MFRRTGSAEKKKSAVYEQESSGHPAERERALKASQGGGWIEESGRGADGGVSVWGFPASRTCGEWWWWWWWW